MSLAQLEHALQHDLQLLAHGGEPWVRPRVHPAGHVYDVVIVGAGQSGLARPSPCNASACRTCW